MLALTRKTDYALVALAHLAQGPDTLVSARGISDLYKIPLPVLMNILKSLSRAGIVTSVRGARGGYRLAADPAQISLRELIVALEGPIRLVLCADGQDSCDCDQAPWCPVKGPARRIHDRLQKFLAGVSLAEIIDDDWQGKLGERQPDEDSVNEASVSG